MHYVRWELTPSEIAAVAAGPVSVVVDHDHYPFEVDLSDDTVAELLTDLRA